MGLTQALGIVNNYEFVMRPNNRIILNFCFYQLRYLIYFTLLDFNQVLFCKSIKTVG